MSADMVPAGTIHDLGYHRYDGPRLGRPQIIRALAWHGFRSAFGFGRGAGAKVAPAVAFAVLCVPAGINAFLVSRGSTRIFSYDAYVPQLCAVVMTLFTAVQAPELVSRDIRRRVLPLYFSRLHRPADYPLAKFLAFTAACLVMTEVPLIGLWAGTIVSVHGGGAVWAQTRALIPGLGIGLLWAVMLAAVSLLLASFTGRRVFATGAIAVFFFLAWMLATILLQAEAHGDPVSDPATAVRIAGLFSPFTLIDGVRRWLGGAAPDQVPAPGGLGVAYAVVLALLIVTALAGLAARYRKAVQP